MDIQILKNGTFMDKWELLEDVLVEPFKVIQDVLFFLYPKHPSHKSVLKTTAQIHVTTQETNFILDVTFVSTIQFDHLKDIPNLENLYFVYTQAVNNWENEIMYKLKKLGIAPFPAIDTIPLSTLKHRLQ